MIPYIIHASILLAFSFLAYWLLLRKETFYKINRLFLVSALVLSVGLPLIQMPQSLSFRKPLVIEVENTNILSGNNKEPNELSIAVLRDSENTSSYENLDELIIQETQSVESGNSLLSTFSEWKTGEILWLIYLIGTSIFILTFLIQFILLFFKKSKLEYIQDGAFKIYELKENSAPFSFLKWIFINPSLYDFDTYNNIIEHEKIHVSQAHYLDKLIAELAVITFWFNPFVWLHRKAINNNLEFLTDSEMIVKGTEKESYQMNLLKVCVPQHALNITTNYNQSFLSERIKMMNSKKSSASSSWKYLLLLPFIGFTLATLNAVKPSYIESNQDPIIVQKSTDSENKIQENLDKPKKKKQKVKIAGISSKVDTKLNEKSESKNKIEDQTNVSETIKSNDFTLNHEQTISEHISTGTENLGQKISDQLNEKLNREKDFGDKTGSNEDSIINMDKTFKDVLAHQNNSDIKPGYWRGLVDGDKACFYLNNSLSSHEQWTMNECFLVNELINFSLGKDVDFHVAREAGKLKFSGSFDGDYEGIGKFKFEANQNFANYLKSNGFETPKDRHLLMLFLADMDKNYIATLKRKGYDPSLDRLIELGIFKIDSERMSECERIFKLVGEDDGSIKDMVEMTIHGVDESFAKGLLQVSSDDLSLKKLIEAKIHGITPSYVKTIKNELGYDDIPLKRIIEFKIHGLSKEEMKNMRKIGYTSLSPKNLVDFSVHGIDADYVQKIRSLGYEDLNPQKLIEFKIHGVNASYISALRKLGYDDLGPNELVAGKIHGVSAEYIRDLKDAGLKGIDFQKAIEGRIHGVSIRFIEKGRKRGYSPEYLSDWIKLAIHGF